MFYKNFTQITFRYQINYPRTAIECPRGLGNGLGQQDRLSFSILRLKSEKLSEILTEFIKHCRCAGRRVAYFFYQYLHESVTGVISAFHIYSHIYLNIPEV